MTSGRYVRQNHQTRVPRRIITMDCEPLVSQSKEWDKYQLHSWRCGAAVFDRLDNGCSKRAEAYATERQEEFWPWVLSHTHPKERLWIFAHNLAFDLTLSNFWGMADSGEVKITRWVIEDPPTIIDANWRGRKIRMCCVQNYWPKTTYELSEALRIKPLPSPGRNARNDQWIELCMSHVDIVRRFMLAWVHFVRYYDLGNFKCSLASQAMATYTHRFMHHRILQHSDKEFAKVERAAYFGGRVMTGFVGNTSATTHHLDVNSLYPYCMATAEYPTEPIFRLDYAQPDELHRQMDRYTAVAEVSIQTESYQYPLRDRGRVYYPRGFYYTTLCGDELLRALHNHHVVACGKAMLYHRRPIFVEWCDTWGSVLMHAKKNGDKVLATITKSLLNSLYGKWAQKNVRWQPVAGIKPEYDYHHWFYRDGMGKRWREMRAVSGCVQEKVEEEDEFGGLVAISACVTSAGRCHMDYLRSLVEPGRVYYQDTDSLIVDCRGRDQLEQAKVVSQTRWGHMKHVRDYSHLSIDGPQRWCGDNVTVHSGVRTDAERVSEGVYLQRTQQGAKTILRTDPQGIVIVRESNIRLNPLQLGMAPDEHGWCHPLVWKGKG